MCNHDSHTIMRDLGLDKMSKFSNVVYPDAMGKYYWVNLRDCLKIASKAAKQFHFLSFSFFPIAKIWTLKFHIEAKVKFK